MSALTVSETLRAAADLIEPAGAWAQGCLGRDQNGKPVFDAGDIGKATCFCMAGAIWRAAGKQPLVLAAFDVLRPRLWHHGIGSWNDYYQRTQAEVVAALRAAADASEGP